MEFIPFHKWDTDDVCKWFRIEDVADIDQVETNIREQRITGEVLPYLAPEDLRALGVDAFGDRIRMQLRLEDVQEMAESLPSAIPADQWEVFLDYVLNKRLRLDTGVEVLCIIASFFRSSLQGSLRCTPEYRICPKPKPELVKYAKMLKMGIPDGAVKNRMKQDGVPAFRFKELRAPVEPRGRASGGAAAPTALDSGMKKYSKMLNMGIPELAVQNKMKVDGVDPRLMNFLAKAHPSKFTNHSLPKLDFYRYLANKRIKDPSHPVPVGAGPPPSMTLGGIDAVSMVGEQIEYVMAHLGRDEKRKLVKLLQRKVNKLESESKYYRGSPMPGRSRKMRNRYRYGE